MSLLELRGVTKKYGEAVVLNDINLSIEPHTTTCLIGASGSGKSTLLKCVNRLEEIQGGSILFEGEPINSEGVNIDDVRRRIGIVFQAYNLFPHMSVIENIMLAPRHVLRIDKEAARERAQGLLDRVGLGHMADAYPDRLSGGQQQRVAIARALALHPKVMLLDEVTSALDPELVGEVLNLIRDLAAGGMTLILATHEMAFARDVATTVCFLEGGRILERGPPDKIFSNPSEERTREFLKRVL